MRIPGSGSKTSNILKSYIVAVLFTGAAIFFSACENDLETIKAFSSPENLPVAEAVNFETVFTDSGQVRFFLKAPKLLRYEREGKITTEFPEGMELIKYDANKQVVSSITANFAKNYIKEEKWEAKNNVIATNAKGDTLKTEHLIWEEKKEKIYTEEHVTIIRPDQVITGIGFVSDETLENWKIKNPSGTIYVTLENESPADTATITREPAPGEPPINFENQLDFGNQ